MAKASKRTTLSWSTKMSSSKTLFKVNTKGTLNSTYGKAYSLVQGNHLMLVTESHMYSNQHQNQEIKILNARDSRMICFKDVVVNRMKGI